MVYLILKTSNEYHNQSRNERSRHDNTVTNTLFQDLYYHQKSNKNKQKYKITRIFVYK